MCFIKTNVEDSNAASSALFLEFPQDEKVKQFSFYTPGNVCILYENISTEGYFLAMKNYEEEDGWIDIEDNNNLPFSSRIEFTCERKRNIDGSPISLSVSKGRGVASLFSTPKRMTIFDLEDDEYGDDEMEEE